MNIKEQQNIALDMFITMKNVIYTNLHTVLDTYNKQNNTNWEFEFVKEEYPNNTESLFIFDKKENKCLESISLANLFLDTLRTDLTLSYQNLADHVMIGINRIDIKKDSQYNYTVNEDFNKIKDISLEPNMVRMQIVSLESISGKKIPYKEFCDDKAIIFYFMRNINGKTEFIPISNNLANTCNINVDDLYNTAIKNMNGHYKIQKDAKHIDGVYQITCDYHDTIFSETAILNTKILDELSSMTNSDLYIELRSTSMPIIASVKESVPFEICLKNLEENKDYQGKLFIYHKDNNYLEEYKKEPELEKERKLHNVVSIDFSKNKTTR